jgi:hypothetical protein
LKDTHSWRFLPSLNWQLWSMVKIF